jgi:hypothetical protein
MIHYDNYVFIRKRRYENFMTFVEYHSFRNEIFIGIIYFYFNGEVGYQSMGGPRSTVKEFNMAYRRWQKENIFRKQMKEIISENRD